MDQRMLLLCLRHARRVANLNLAARRQRLPPPSLCNYYLSAHSHPLHMQKRGLGSAGGEALFLFSLSLFFSLLLLLLLLRRGIFLALGPFLFIKEELGGASERAHTHVFQFANV
jgi:hypothetical protein